MTNSSALIVPAQPLAASNAAPAAFQEAVKPLIAIPNGWLWFFWIAGILLAAGLAYFYWRWSRKKAAARKIVPPVPAHVRARRMLDAAWALLSEPKPFSIAVSGAIRDYLEERFNFHAPDRTTEEFLYELQNTNLLTAEQKQSLAGFLASCDLIKFAQYEPTEVELRALHASALRLVNETEPRLVPESVQSTVAPRQTPPPIPATS
ncbi:MAG TPA: hypothetical protein VFC44_16870 [Candidatus Saccharimonadales bacterium]|nr:hypothetical protein [Candidatus Saccharimonadales bacterium]